MSANFIRVPKVFLFGNSITQVNFSVDGCWGTLLADKLQRKCDVLNRGFSGYNSTWNRIILPRLVDESLAKDIVAFTIFLGANDSNRKELNPRQHVSLEQYKVNMQQMIQYLKSIGISESKLIIIGPPPCHEEAWRNVCLAEGKTFGKDNAEVARYSESCAAVTQEIGVEFLELYNNMMAEENWHTMFSDGLHFSARGSIFLFDKLWPMIETRIAHLPENILPLWKDIDVDNPEKSLLS